MTFLLGLALCCAESPDKFALHDQERIVLIGDGLIERSQRYGYLETVLRTRFPGSKLVVRNLGWNADTPAGLSRAYFDEPQKGYERLQEQVRSVDPTVLIVGYGMAASFDGSGAASRFGLRLAKTVHDVRGNARVILLSPISHEYQPPPLPDPLAHNRALKAFSSRIQSTAAENDWCYVDLFSVRDPYEKPSISDNGIHLSAAGYWWAAHAIAGQLGVNRGGVSVVLDASGKVLEQKGTRISGASASAERIAFTQTDERLPSPPRPNSRLASAHESAINLSVKNLKPGGYQLLCEEKVIAEADATVWAKGIQLHNAPQHQQVEQLREKVIRNNRLYFLKYRPQNITYLLGFRKHEQGMNAGELDQLDRHIAENEEEIHGLQAARPVSFELKRVSSPDAYDPLTELKSLKVPDGYDVQLFSADPAIAKPIQINFDAQGRLWVVSSESYPQLEPGAPPRDKVFVLEDADGDGRADKSTIFADNLLLPTGIEIGDGGVYVGQSTQLLHLSDSDGDGRADQSKVVLAGFGTEDTHHLIHTFRWGPGGQMHFAQSIYIHSHVETPRGIQRLNGGGFWIFRPDSMRLRPFVYGMVNSWGIAFDDYGQSFGVDNDHAESAVKYFLPGARLNHTPNETHILAGIVQNKPKYCGAEIITGRHFGDDWYGDLVTCDFRAHRVCRYKLRDNGAGFIAEEQQPLVVSDNIAFRPIDVKLGPDGALYICDFYNPIINHGEVDFRDPRRDKTHGRIWRVSRKDRPLVERPRLLEASIDELLAAQTAREAWTRHFARRVLADHDPGEVMLHLKRWAGRQSDEKLLLRALWIQQTVDRPSRELLDKLLSAKDPNVRAAAVRVLSHWRDQVDNPAVPLDRLVVDDHPRVRLEAVRALALIDEPESMKTALQALSKPMDRFLDYAVKLNARESWRSWLPVLKKTLDSLTERDASRWVYALLALESNRAAGPLLGIWRRNLVPTSDEAKVLDFVARYGSPDDLRVVFDRIVGTDEEMTDEERRRLLASLLEAQRLRKVRPSGDLAQPLESLVQRAQADLKREVVLAAARWDVDKLRTIAVAWATDKEATGELRGAAIEALGIFGDEKSLETLESVVNEAGDADLRNLALRELAAKDAQRAAALAGPLLQSINTPEEINQIVDVFVSLRHGPDALTGVVESMTLKPEAAREAVSVAEASGQLAPALIAALRKAGGLKETTRDLTKDQLASLVQQVRSRGDAHRGSQIYKREKLTCVKCHAVGGAGGKVGPDLSGIGASAPVDYLIESLVSPSKKIKENFHSTTVLTTEGTILTGIQVSKTDNELVLRNNEDKLVSVPTRDIEATKISKTSLMPAGILDSLDSQEFLDLARYLSELGKPGPFGPKQELINRQWRLLGPFTREEAPAVEEKLLAAGADHRKAAQGWVTSKTTNAGWTYLRDFALKPEAPILFASCRIVADRPAKARVWLKPPDAAHVLLNDAPVERVHQTASESVYELPLKQGVNFLLVKIDLKSVPRFLMLRGYGLDPETAVHFGEPVEAIDAQSGE